MIQGSVQRSQHEANAGISALQQGRKADAGVHFWRALTCLDDVQDIGERRKLLSKICDLLFAAGFDDLSLMAVVDGIEADKRLGDNRGLAKDQITYANLQTRLGNLEEAEQAYRSITASCLQNQDFANAASASTNLATLLANDGYLAEAITLLENSLQYLEQERFPDTEIKTRLMLIQVLELEQRDPDSIFEVARTLLDRFAPDLASNDRSALIEFLDDAAKRAAVGHPEMGAEDWKKRAFPALYGP